MKKKIEIEITYVVCAICRKEFCNEDDRRSGSTETQIANRHKMLAIWGIYICFQCQRLEVADCNVGEMIIDGLSTEFSNLPAAKPKSGDKVFIPQIKHENELIERQRDYERRYRAERDQEIKERERELALKLELEKEKP